MLRHDKFKKPHFLLKISLDRALATNFRKKIFFVTENLAKISNKYENN